MSIYLNIAMIKEWILIVWLGTTTNFTIQGVYWQQEDCQRQRAELATTLDSKFVIACVQDFREGRSQYPSSGANVGIVK